MTSIPLLALCNYIIIITLKHTHRSEIPPGKQLISVKWTLIAVDIYNSRLLLLQSSTDLCRVMWRSGWQQDCWAALPWRRTQQRAEMSWSVCSSWEADQTGGKHCSAVRGAESYMTCHHPNQRSALEVLWWRLHCWMTQRSRWSYLSRWTTANNSSSAVLQTEGDFQPGD